MDLIQNNLPTILVTAFFAILFLQSGLDKVFNYRGNLEYFGDHFKNSPLSGTVWLLMPVITILETSTGVVSAIALLQTLLSGHSDIAIYSPGLAGISFLCLFFGQRLAKDYAGAATIAAYFAIAVLGCWGLKGGG